MAPNFSYPSAWDICVDPDTGLPVVAGRQEPRAVVGAAPIDFNSMTSIFPRGKYSGKMVEEVIRTDPGYLIWCDENAKNWRFAMLLIDAAHCQIEVNRRGKA